MKPRFKRKILVPIGILVALTMIFVVAVPVSAYITTDQEDYAPGSVVTISGDNSDGAGYLPGETVVVEVSGPNEYVASFEAVVGEDGSWSGTVQLWDSDLAVGEYSYTATGQSSGVVESGTFTDATPTIDSLSPTSGPVGTTVTVNGSGFHNGDTITIKFDGSPVATDPATVTVSGNSFTCDFDVPSISAGTYPVLAINEADGGDESDSADFEVTSTNNPPVITESDPVGVTMDEDGSPTPFSLTLHATDADEGDEAILTWSISSAASHGTASTTPGMGNSNVIGYTPTANYNGGDSFDVEVDDGTDTDTITVNVTIDPINDPPAGTDNTVSTFVNIAYIFATADFGFTDPLDSPADSLLAVKITTLPSDGVLENDGSPVSADDDILASDIIAGDLEFIPDTDEFGAPYASFTFQVQDDGGTASGGVDLDQSPNTMTINVTPEPGKYFNVDEAGLGDHVLVQIIVMPEGSGWVVTDTVPYGLTLVSDEEDIEDGIVGGDADVIVAGNTVTVTLATDATYIITFECQVTDVLAYKDIEVTNYADIWSPPVAVASEVEIAVPWVLEDTYDDVLTLLAYTGFVKELAGGEDDYQVTRTPRSFNMVVNIENTLDIDMCDVQVKDNLPGNIVYEDWLVDKGDVAEKLTGNEDKNQVAHLMWDLGEDEDGCVFIGADIVESTLTVSTDTVGGKDGDKNHLKNAGKYTLNPGATLMFIAGDTGLECTVRSASVRVDVVQAAVI